MKIHRVIGSVTLSRCHPSFQAATLLATEPEGLACLGLDAPTSPDMVIVWDEQGAGFGSRVAISDGAEAAQAFRPELKAVDAYCSAILDTVYVDAKAIEKLNIVQTE